MRNKALGAFCAVFAYCSSAHAGAPLSAQTLGLLDAILSFCSEVDEQNSAQFRQIYRAATGDSRAADLDALKNTDEFRKSFQALHDAIRQMPRAAATAACKSGLPPQTEKRHDPRGGDDDRRSDKLRDADQPGRGDAKAK